MQAAQVPLTMQVTQAAHVQHTQWAAWPPPLLSMQCLQPSSLPCAQHGQPGPQKLQEQWA